MRKFGGLRDFTALCTSLTALVSAFPAMAQTADADKASDPKLEVIEITADRPNSYSADLVQAGSFRGATQMETPLTIAVITSELLQSQQAIDIMDALKNTSGVSASSNGPAVYNNLTIRGIPVDTRQNFRLNGSLPILSSIAFPLEDKDRVEVLKGASALYYGFSNPSGIVNLTMKRPTKDLLLNTTAFGDDNGGKGFAVDLGDTFGDFGMRLNGVYAGLDTGIKYADGHRYLVSGAFDYHPSDSLLITLDVENFEKSLVEPGSFRFSTTPKSTIANPYPQMALPQLADPSTNFGPAWATNDAKETNVLLQATYFINDAWSVVGDVGYSILDRSRYIPTFNPTNLVTGAGTLTVSPQKSWFDSFYYRAELDGAFNTWFLSHEVMMGVQEGIKKAHTPIATKVNYADNYLNPVDIAPPVFLTPNVDTTQIDDFGLYFFDRIKVTDWLQVLGGLRWSRYTESDVTTNVDTYGPATPKSYSYGAVVTPAKWLSLYGTYITGLETTALGPTTANNPAAQLPPTESNQKEFGIKVEPWKGLLGQVAYFDINRGAAYVNAANFYVQDGRSQYKGVEASLSGEVTKDFSVYLSGMILSAKQVAGAATVLGPTFVPTTVGRRVEATPEHTLSLSVEYRPSWWIEGLAVTGAAYYVSDQAINATNNGFIPAYTTFDLGASYKTEIASKPVTFRLNGQNIMDKAYWASTGGLFLSEGLPATVKFSASVNF